MSAFDLGNLDTTTLSNEGVVMPVVNPMNGQPTGFNIKLAGVDSVPYREATRATAKRQIRASVHRSSGQMPSDHEIEAMLDTIEENEVEVLAACVLDWWTDEGEDGERIDGCNFKGEVLKCTKANAKRLLAEVPVVRRKVKQFVEDEKNFLPNS